MSAAERKGVIKGKSGRHSHLPSNKYRHMVSPGWGCYSPSFSSLQFHECSNSWLEWKRWTYHWRLVTFSLSHSTTEVPLSPEPLNNCHHCASPGEAPESCSSPQKAAENRDTIEALYWWTDSENSDFNFHPQDSSHCPYVLPYSIQPPKRWSLVQDPCNKQQLVNNLDLFSLEPPTCTPGEVPAQWQSLRLSSS